MEAVEQYNARKSLQRASGVKQPPVVLNINKFKRFLTVEHPELSKSERNAAIKSYKEKGWQEYADIVKYMGSYPSHSTVQADKEEKDGKSEE